LDRSRAWPTSLRASLNGILSQHEVRTNEEPRHQPTRHEARSVGRAVRFRNAPHPASLRTASTSLYWRSPACGSPCSRPAPPTQARGPDRYAPASSLRWAQPIHPCTGVRCVHLTLTDCVRFYVRVASACRPPKPRAPNRYQSMISTALSLEPHHSWKFQKHVTPRAPDLVGRVQLPPLPIDRPEPHSQDHRLLRNRAPRSTQLLRHLRSGQLRFRQSP
jgi:hypothetical protein